MRSMCGGDLDNFQRLSGAICFFLRMFYPLQSPARKHGLFVSTRARHTFEMSDGVSLKTLASLFSPMKLTTSYVTWHHPERIAKWLAHTRAVHSVQ
jgi:hypothetical protein